MERREGEEVEMPRDKRKTKRTKGEKNDTTRSPEEYDGVKARIWPEKGAAGVTKIQQE